MTRADRTDRTTPTRLARFLLKRLRREAEFIAAEKAIDVGVLSAETKKIGKHRVLVYKPGIVTASADEAGILRRLKSAIRVVSHQSVRYELDNDEIMATFDDDLPGAISNEKTLGMPVPTDQEPRLHVRRLMDLIAESAEPPRAGDVATLLMIAEAVNQYPPGLAGIFQVLGRSRPVVVITGEVRGFESALLSLMKRSLVTIGAVTKTNGYIDWSRREPQFDHVRSARNKIICFPGQDYHETGLVDRIDYAARSPYPIVAVAEAEEDMPSQLIEAAHLHLACSKLTPRIIELTIETVLGPSPMLELSAADCKLLGLADLDLAIRPGNSSTRAIEILAELAAVKRQDPESYSSGKTRDNFSQPPGTSSTNKKNAKSTGSEIIHPFNREDRENRKVVPLVETLAGYGDAQDWAMDLKLDLTLWRSGEVEWCDMSTKLLLSGSPGTGKSYFAKALCNSLQIPLIATSVATWLEGGHLGDDLRRMSDTFKEAQAHRPCILFIDEIDGIGTRGNDRGRYSDYWNTLTNRALELFDGVVKTEGVILVAATNLPALIDPALLRSGRLERHIPIPQPNIDTLCGILKHQIGTDLEHIVPSGLEASQIRSNDNPPFSGGTAGVVL